MTSAKISGFLQPPLVTVTNQLILFLLYAFGGPPLPTHCGRHIWRPPKGVTFPYFAELEVEIRANRE